MLFNYLNNVASYYFSRFDLKDIAGRNGPHDQRMNVNRNLCHWVITLSYLKYHNELDDSLNRIFEEASELFLKILNKQALVPTRETPYKDRYNGLVGQAWVLEAGLYFNKYFGNSATKRALNNFLNKFGIDEDYHLWKLKSNIDITINQQIFFTYIVGQLVNSGIADKKVEKDFQKVRYKLLENISTNYDGLMLLTIRKKNFFKNLILNRKYFTNNYQKKILPYHIFSLIGLVNLYDIEKIEHLIKAVLQNINKYDLKLYGYYYNISGFELAYVLKKANLSPHKIYYERQIQITNNIMQCTGKYNDVDIHTYFARQYEGIRLFEECL